MSTDERILSVIQALYDAALDEKLWTEALTGLTTITSSQAATFWVLDSSREPRLPTLTCLNFDPAFIAEYHNGMVPLDPTVQYLVAHPNQPIVHDGLVISERDKDRHIYYDWHGRHSDTRHRLVGQSRPAQDVQAGVALHRSRKVGPYEPVDIGQFGLLHRHLERALAIGFRLGTLGTMRQCTMELLDRNPAAIVLLDHHRRVVYMNRGAIGLGIDADGIHISSRGLELSHRQDHEHLQDAISKALGKSPSKGSFAGAVRAIRPSGKRPYSILVSPMTKGYPALSMFRPAVCVVITDPEQPRSPLKSRLTVMFGLTSAEARLADRLAAGDSLRRAAAGLGITYGTARTRLVEIFQKTETHRQAELVSLLLMLGSAD